MSANLVGLHLSGPQYRPRQQSASSPKAWHPLMHLIVGPPARLTTRNSGGHTALMSVAHAALLQSGPYRGVTSTGTLNPAATLTWYASPLGLPDGPILSSTKVMGGDRPVPQENAPVRQLPVAQTNVLDELPKLVQWVRAQIQPDPCGMLKCLDSVVRSLMLVNMLGKPGEPGFDQITGQIV